MDLLRTEYHNMASCVRCGLCLSVCPTYQMTVREEESPRGRIAMARALVEGHLAVTADLVEHELSCLLCEACTAVCPAGVRMEQMSVPLRAVLAASAPSSLHLSGPIWQWLAFQVFRDMRLFRGSSSLLRLYQRSGLQFLARASGVLRFLGLDRAERFLPPLDNRFLVADGQVWHPPKGEVRDRVYLFVGCIMSTAFAGTSRATAQVLAAHGYEVVAVRGQGCCGALNAHGGDLDGAVAMARRNVDAFEPEAVFAGLTAARSSSDQGPWVVVNAAGCGAILKEYQHLLAQDRAYGKRAARFSARVRDVIEVLDDVEPVAPLRPLKVRAVYQDPCHLAHAQRITQQPRRLLRRVPGLELVEMAEPTMCCGSAGIYNLTHPAMADRLLERKVKNILATGAQMVVSANPGCMIQIQEGLRRAGSPIQVRHLVDVLHEAVGGESV